MGSFEAFVDITLKLTIDGTETEIPAGQVEKVKVDLHPWGFDAEVAFWLTSLRTADSLFASFSGKKLIQATLTAAPPTEDGSDAPANQTIDITGYVTDKEVLEQTVKATNTVSVKFRRYVIKFQDVAQVLWRQHWPNDLFVDQKFQDVVDAHKGDKITITMSDWAVTQTVFPIHFLGLGADRTGASFYDFFIWFIDTQNGILSYDPVANSYKLIGTKDAEGTAGKLQPVELEGWHVEFPATPRYKVNVQNSDSASAASNEIANEEAATGLRQDFLVRTTIAQQVTDRVTLETARLILREHEVVVDFAAWPTTGFLPGALLDFTHSDFGAEIFTATNTYRSRSIHFECSTPVDRVRLESPTAVQAATVSLEARLELQAETFVALPAYDIPGFVIPGQRPIRVEGTVVSEQGEDTEETYQFYTDSNTSVDQYKVKIPLWKDDNSGEGKIVVCPYEPTNFTSHHYFPLIKNERVLVAMWFRGARIERTLDWRAGAKLPMDGQGDAIVLGKKAEDQTTVVHNYVDAKPVLTIKRIKDKDTETITIQDGRIQLHTEETQ